MAQVTIVLGAPTATSPGAWVQWDNRQLPSALGDISVFSDTPSETRYLVRVRMFRNGQVQFQTIDVPDGGSGFGSEEDLSDAWERDSAAFTLQVAGLTDLVVTGPTNAASTNPDPTEPYAYTNGNTVAQAAWFDSYDLAASATIIIDDGGVDAGDVSWLFTVFQPTVRYALFSAVDAGDVSWTFTVFQPSVTLAGYEQVDAGDASWIFTFFQPSVTYVPYFQVDAGDVEWSFAFAEPSVVASYDVDAGDVSWTFAFAEPKITRRHGNTIIREFESILADPFSTYEELAMEYWAALPFSQIDVSAYKDLLNPLRCPIAFLPELADLLQAYTWAPFMPEAYQRRAVADWWYYYRYRTTQAALRRWMETIQSLYSLRFVEEGTPARKTELTVNMSDTPLVPVTTEIRQWEIDTVRRILGWPFMIDPINVIFANTYQKSLRMGMGFTVRHFKGW